MRGRLTERWLGLLLASASALSACGGRTDERDDRGSTPRAGGGGAPVGVAGVSNGGGGSGSGAMPSGGAGAGGETCYDTPRNAEDLAVNRETLEMVALAPPDRPVPLVIELWPVDFDFSTAATGKTKAQLIEERKEQLEPYQAPVLQLLTEASATAVSSLWVTNTITATVPARAVPSIFCLPNVVYVQVDAGFWTIAEPPWNADVGPLQCPMEGDGCPAHCFGIKAAPVVDGVACGCDARVVACGREPVGIDDGEPICRRNEAGELLIFRGAVPDQPDYYGFRDCIVTRWQYVEMCGRDCFE